MKEDKVLRDLLDECAAHIILGHKMHPTHVTDMLKKAYQAGGGRVPVKCWECLKDVEGLEWAAHRQVVLCNDCKNKEEEEDHEGYELINCSECGKDKWVEEGTWALDKGMCEPCYCAYEGG